MSLDAYSNMYVLFRRFNRSSLVFRLFFCFSSLKEQMYAFLECMSRNLALNAAIPISVASTFHILIPSSILGLKEGQRVEKPFVPSFTMRYWYFYFKLYFYDNRRTNKMNT